MFQKMSLQLLFLLFLSVIGSNSQDSAAGVAKGGLKGQAALQMAKKIKEEMTDFYKSEQKSQIDLQKSIKNRGFSQIYVNCEEGQTIVDLCSAREIVEIYIENLRDLLPSKIFEHCNKFLSKWDKITLNKFTKKQIMFAEHGDPTATFVGVFQQRTNNQLYVCYKVCKNAFKLAPDIYVVRESSSESAFWGAVQSSSTIDQLEHVTRGFDIQDLTALLQITSVSVLDLNLLQQLK